ncbi:MAG: PAS domain-containing sensor histidine kinase [Pseudomonadota bacterium]
MEFRPLSFCRKLASRAKGGPVWRGGPGDIVAVVSEDGRIREISASATIAIGAAGNLVGRSFFDFVRRDDRALVRQALHRACSGEKPTNANGLSADFHLLRVQRAPALADVAFKPLRPGRAMALIRDRGEDFERLRKARESVERAEDAASLRADLLADLGHEMKTPLNAMMGFAGAIEAETFGKLGADDAASEKYKEYARLIQDSGGHLLELITAILDYARLEAGRYKLDAASAAPAALAQSCAAMLRAEAEKSGLAFTVEIADDLPDVTTDPRAVRQILINLLSNAVKFTKDGAISLSVSEKCGAIDFVVQDTGIGMSEAALAKIGDRFTDAHKNGVRGTKGSGLGLALAHSLADLLGGALRIHSVQGKGTTAQFTLPIRTDMAVMPEPEMPALEPAEALADIQSQLDRVAAFRREHRASAA